MSSLIFWKILTTESWSTSFPKEASKMEEKPFPWPSNRSISFLEKIVWLARRFFVATLLATQMLKPFPINNMVPILCLSFYRALSLTMHCNNSLFVFALNITFQAFLRGVHGENCVFVLRHARQCPIDSNGKHFEKSMNEKNDGEGRCENSAIRFHALNGAKGPNGTVSQ